MSGKNLVLEWNAKMLLANQISGFLNFKISKTIGGIKWIFLHAASYLIKVISWSCKFRWVWSAMTKEAFKTLISQKLIEVESWFCACNFIFCQLSCHVGISEWIYTLQFYSVVYELIGCGFESRCCHAISYILKAQIITHVILDGHGHITGFYWVAYCFFVFDFISVFPRLLFSNYQYLKWQHFHCLFQLTPLI